ncbi:MAG TPA: hypothetical protein VGH38_14975 [Bryobacteraceae bacterium]
MSDVATPNLPSRDFERTSQLYVDLGLTEVWRDEGWMMLKRGDLTLEFFPHPELDPLTSWCSLSSVYWWRFSEQSRCCKQPSAKAMPSG